MYDLFEDLKSEAVLMKILEATEAIRDRVPQRDRVIVAETINGRTVRAARRGLIYVAYDLKNIPAARPCNEIKLELGLWES